MRKLIALLCLLALMHPARAAIISSGSGTTFGSSATVSSFSLNRPASVNIDDILFVQITLSDTTVTVSTAPVGWTLLSNDTNSTIRQYMYYRIATVLDIGGAATTWTLSGAANVAAAMVGFRSDLGGRTAIYGSISTTASAGNSTTLSAATVTATAPGRLLRFYGHASTNVLGVGGSTLTANAAIASASSATLLAASRVLNASGATGADSITATTSARYIAHSVLLTESQPNKPSGCFSDDFTNTTTFGQNWVTTTVGSTAFTPAITGGRLRLTSNNGYISTAASLQRLFPTSNLIYVEFNYYSYPSGSGADGVAVTLSDANVTPQPGGFGGSLGYAPRDGTISGFAGGWVGIALDEYGNYSNPNEGRNGGPGFRADSVAIRGSGSVQTGYAYVTGTAAGLNPGVDAATANANTAGPGHRYRIVIDAAGTGQTYVTVDRDTTGTGNSYTNLIPTFNLEASSGQAAIPANLMLSFTGSTGGSSNVHEIGNLSVCATNIQSVNQVDHFEFQYATPGLTCEPSTVTVLACANAACSSLMPGTTTATLSPASGWAGGNTVQLVNGTATLQLRKTSAGTAALGVASSSPGAKPFGQYKCNGTSVAAGTACSLPFNDAGLSFDVPNILANKPSGAVRLRAVRNSGDAANSCVALFQNTTQSVNFWSTYSTPNTGTRSVELRAGSGSGTFTSIGKTLATATAIPLVFNNAGETTFEARYNDAGLMALNAQYVGSGTYAGLIIPGTDPFVAKPAGLCVAPTPTPTPCTSSYNQCAPYVAAGMPFQLRVTAAAWESDSDTDFCTGNNTTPNYTQTVPLAPQLISPTAGNAGALAAYSSPATPTTSAAITGGTVNLSDLTESEVGVFKFVATPATNGYFSETVNGGQSVNVGRFVPYRFDVAATAAIRNDTGWSCAFTYQDQPFGFDYDSLTNTDYSPVVTITAMNARNIVTLNYDAGDIGSESTTSFWTLGSGLAHSYTHAAPPAAGGTLVTTASNPLVTPKAATLNTHDGKRDYQLTGEAFSYTRSATPNAPFTTNLLLNIAQTALTSSTETFLDPTSLVSTDQACYRSGCPSTGTALCTNACSAYASAPINNRSGNPLEIRYGRIRVDSAAGPSDLNLPMPVTAEYWDGTTSSFITNTADNCTVVNGAAATLSATLGAATTSGNATLVNGRSQSALVVTAPGAGVFGNVGVTLNLNTWLQYFWNGTALSNPSATASFGLYRGSDRVIYWQETQ